MSIPSAYTADDLKAFMLRVLGEVAGVLGWDATTPDLDEVLTETLIVYGAASLADCADVPRLRVLARWQLWRAAVDALAGIYTVNAPEGMLSRAQVFDQASKRLAAAEAEALPLVDAGAPGTAAYRARIIPIVRRRRSFSGELYPRPEA